MQSDLNFDRDAAIIRVPIYDKNGTIVGAPMQIRLRVGSAGEIARQIVSAIAERKGDLNRTVDRQLRMNQQRVADILDQIERTRSVDSVARWNEWLNEFLNYADFLESSTPVVTETQEGSLHIIRNQSGPTQPATFVVMFAPYSTPGGAMKPVELVGDQELHDFLIRVGMSEPEAGAAVAKAHQGVTSQIVNVVLSLDSQRKLGLL